MDETRKGGAKSGSRGPGRHDGSKAKSYIDRTQNY